MQNYFEGIGDLAYVGIGETHTDWIVAVPRGKHRREDRPPEDLRYNRALSRRRIIVEYVIGRMRRFRAVTDVNRHRRKGQVVISEVEAVDALRILGRAVARLLHSPLR